ncbi:FHA domain-containing protein FHA2-like, partial [Punica granatum]|uniref:FHA domain-containing protein FHA2-like n=1 Tax=Punica granatum TaxID=22663 RepID=A0A6P8BTH4_PUNGR
FLGLSELKYIYIYIYIYYEESHLIRIEVEGVLHLPGTPPVKLDSQDLLQIGDKKFYFLLPVRSILGCTLGPRHHVAPPPAPVPVMPPPYGYQLVGTSGSSGGKKGRGREYYMEEYEEDDDGIGGGGGGGSGGGAVKKLRREGFDGYGYGGGAGIGGKTGVAHSSEKKGDGQSRVDREADNQQLLQLEEKDVVSSVATVLSDVCGPREWMPMDKLHAELVENYSNVWHHSRVRRYLTSEEWPGLESLGKPWYGLLMLLRKNPEHFVINTRSKGRVTQEFVSLVSLLS